jgi:hypothetical protein
MKYKVQDGFPYYIELLGNADYKALFSSQENFTLLTTISEEEASIAMHQINGTIKQILGHDKLTTKDYVHIVHLRFSRKRTQRNYRVMIKIYLLTTAVLTN